MSYVEARALGRIGGSAAEMLWPLILAAAFVAFAGFIGALLAIANLSEKFHNTGGPLAWRWRTALTNMRQGTPWERIGYWIIPFGPPANGLFMLYADVVQPLLWSIGWMVLVLVAYMLLNEEPKPDRDANDPSN
jgi:hypothetical protein